MGGRGTRAAAVVAAVALLHGLALLALAGGAPQTPAATLTPPSTLVRTIVANAAPAPPGDTPVSAPPAAARSVAPPPAVPPAATAKPDLAAAAPRAEPAGSGRTPAAAADAPAPAAPTAPTPAAPPQTADAPAAPMRLAAAEAVPADPAPAPDLARPGPGLVPVAATAAEPPRYRAQLPPSFEARFTTRRGLLSAQADWRFAAGDGSYRLELHTHVFGREISHMRSEGRTAASGLQPLRFVDGKRGRDQRAVNFQRDAAGGGRISFSGPATTLPLPEGVQDRLSWLLQLAAIAEAEPARRERGARVSMWVVTPRGEADLWTFVVGGPETLDGGRTALVLRRAPDRAFDTEVQVWLDPQAHYLPLRAIWRNEGDDSTVELRRDALSLR